MDLEKDKSRKIRLFNTILGLEYLGQPENIYKEG